MNPVGTKNRQIHATYIGSTFKLQISKTWANDDLFASIRKNGKVLNEIAKPFIW